MVTLAHSCDNSFSLLQDIWYLPNKARFMIDALRASATLTGYDSFKSDNFSQDVDLSRHWVQSFQPNVDFFKYCFPFTVTTYR